MPPKGNGDRPPLVSNSQSHRDHFSIASFFDAATARRSGGANRFGSYPSLSQPSSQSSSREGYGIGSTMTGQPPHWSSASHPSPHPRSGNDAPQHSSSSSSGSSTSSLASADVSSTLQGVRTRIVRELEEGQLGSREAASRLHTHRQRALRVAFGVDTASAPPQPPLPPQRSSHGGGRSTGSAAGGSAHGPASTSPNKGRSSEKKNGDDDDDDGEELMVASVEFSLLCPYSRLPMRYPVRSRDCSHLQCCDLESWVVMLDKCRSMRDPVGPCPVCERRVSASSLEVDLWMKNVMDQMPSGTHMVVLEPDGSFRNGDATRERRKEEMTEVVDATQGDFENYLGDVIDDDGDGGEVAVVAPASGSKPAGDAAATLAAALAAAGSRVRQRSPTPPSSAQRGSGQPPVVQVKQEKAAMAAATPSPPPSPSQDDGGVVVVHFEEGRHDGLQALPSQVRLWVPHCTQCGAPRVKAEDGSVEGCPQCGQTARERWNLVRRFEASPAVSMELMADGTLVLHGVDLIAPYLYRAGFQRSLFEVMEYAPLAERQRQLYRPPPGVWATSLPLSRFEIDFLEACCAMIAEGKTLDAIENLIVPGLFRIPRRRRPMGAGAGHNPSQRGIRVDAASTPYHEPHSERGTIFTQGGSPLMP